MRFSLILGVISVSVMTMTGLAGPLEAPAGPIVSTMKTLDEVEPRIPIGPDTTPGDAECVYRITQPGSYYLTENLQGELGKHGIVIATPQVSLDLNGFVIAGPDGPKQGTYHGIRAAVLLKGATIQNGQIRDWSGDGLSLRDIGQSLHESVVVKDIHAIGNTETGINAFTDSSIITRCSATANQNGGIFGWHATVTECVADRNLEYGIYVLDGIASRCFASTNWVVGIQIIRGTVKDCVLINNFGAGIEAGSSMVIENVLFSNDTIDKDGAGIVASVSCVIRDNLCGSNDFGIRVEGEDNFITGNKCRDNGVNWFIVAGNFYGPIIDRTAVTPGGVFGNAASGTLGTSDPNANFSY